jgi:hypothetical protein
VLARFTLAGILGPGEVIADSLEMGKEAVPN